MSITLLDQHTDLKSHYYTALNAAGKRYLSKKKNFCEQVILFFLFPGSLKFMHILTPSVSQLFYFSWLCKFLTDLKLYLI